MQFMYKKRIIQCFSLSNKRVRDTERQREAERESESSNSLQINNQPWLLNLYTHTHTHTQRCVCLDAHTLAHTVYDAHHTYACESEIDPLPRLSHSECFRLAVFINDTDVFNLTVVA